MSLWPELASGEYRMHYVNAGGLKTRCLEAGAGRESVLFLHGSGGHLEAYTRNILPHAARYKVYVKRKNCFDAFPFETFDEDFSTCELHIQSLPPHR